MADPRLDPTAAHGIAPPVLPAGARAVLTCLPERNKGLAAVSQALGETGGAGRDRTDDLYNAIVALSQLSYGPTVSCPLRVAARGRAAAGGGQGARPKAGHRSRVRTGSPAKCAHGKFPQEIRTGEIRESLRPQASENDGPVI